MAKLGFNFYGYQFEEGLKTLKLAYAAASVAADQGFERAREEAFAHQQAIAQGAEPEVAYDEDGNYLWDRQTILDMDAAAAEAATQDTRKAFVIAVYHLWERFARQWTGLGAKGDHALIAEATTAMGQSPHPRFEAVKSLANLLKHGNPARFKDVHEQWFEVTLPVAEGATSVDWYEQIHLTDDQMSELFKAVEQSAIPFIVL